MRYLLPIFILLCSFQPAHRSTFRQLAALKGTWKMSATIGAIYEEWKPASNGTMTGRSYKLNGSDTILFESIVLSCDDKGIYYIPSTENQNNRQPITFTIVSSAGNTFTFENKLHDFPQRIIYKLIGTDSLAARIEGTKDGKFRGQDYHFSRLL